jgi:dTDP-4-amino-4,6-dideoxygalactose transaminase
VSRDGNFAVPKRPLSSAARVGGGCQDLSERPDERWPFYDEDEIAAVSEVLRSGKVNQWTGPEVFEFEDACASRFGGGRGIAVANGSLALELALRAFGIGPGDEVVVSPRSFVASSFCALLVGAKPVFADVDCESGNITPETIARVLTDKTRAVIPVHLAGWPANMPAIMDLVATRNIRVIEDCAQAHGARIHGRSVGSFGDAAAFSFCQDKILSTGGEGGFITFKDRSAWEWARSFKDHGKSFAKMQLSTPPGQFRWVHDEAGTNWRLTGLQAAIGLLQLEKLEQWSSTRARNAGIWRDALREIGGLRLPLPAADWGRHAFYKFYFYIDGGTDEAASALRAEILSRSAEAGLKVFSGSCSEMYLERAFDGHSQQDCPVSRSLGLRSLMVEVHPTLRPDLLQTRAERLADIVGTALSSTDNTP